MSGGSKTQTVQNTTEIPQYVSDAQQNFLNLAGQFTSPFTSPPTGSTVAGLTPSQTRAIDLGNQAADYASGVNMTFSPMMTSPASADAMTINPVTADTMTINPVTADTMTINPVTADARYVPNVNAPPAATANGKSIRDLLNPFTRDVVDPTVELMRRELGKTLAGISARNASSAAFGGSRGALQSAEATRAFGDQVALTTAQLMSQGYDRATATALANASATNNMEQFNANLTTDVNARNAAAYNAMAEANANREADVNARNQAAINAMAEANANRASDVNARNQAAINAAAEANAQRIQQTGQFNSGAVERGAQLQNQFATDNLSRRLSALQQLLGVGGVEQQTNQNILNEPINMLKLYGSAVPFSNVGATTTQTSPSNAPSTLQTVGGLGLSGLGMALPYIVPALTGSDRRMKTDIKKIGTDRASGLNLYAYRYKGDPKSYPKVVGPMAQEIEKKYPGAVSEMGGRKVVNTSALAAMLGVGG